MPPTVPYILAALGYAAVAGVALVAALLLAALPRTRRVGRQAAAAVLASGPGILAYQALAVPVVVAAAVVHDALMPVGGASQSPAAWGADALLLLALGLFAAATLLGWVVGLRAGWDLGGGVSARVVWRGLPLYGRLARRGGPVHLWPNEALQLTSTPGRGSAALGGVAPRRRRAPTARN